jgi:hypothetical protein
MTTLVKLYKCSTDIVFGQDYTTTILDECHYLRGVKILAEGTPEYYEALKSPVSIVTSVPQALPDVDPSMMPDVDTVTTIATPLLHHPPTDVLTMNVVWVILFAFILFGVLAVIFGKGNDTDNYATYGSSYSISDYHGETDIPYQYIEPHYSNGNFVRGHYRKERGWKRR